MQGIPFRHAQRMRGICPPASGQRGSARRILGRRRRLPAVLCGRHACQTPLPLRLAAVVLPFREKSRNLPRHSTAPSVPVIPRPVRGISPFPATRWTFLTSSGPEEDHAGVFPAPWSYIKHCPRRPDGSPRTRGLDNHRLFFNTADRSTVIFVVTVIIWQWICVQGRRTFQTLIGCTPNQRTLFYFV